MALGFAEIFQEPPQIDNNRKIIETQSFYPKEVVQTAAKNYWKSILNIINLPNHAHLEVWFFPWRNQVQPLSPKQRIHDVGLLRSLFLERDVFFSCFFFPRKNNLPSMKKWEIDVKFQFRISNKKSMLFWMKYFQKHSTILKMPPQLASEKANMAATWA